MQACGHASRPHAGRAGGGAPPRPPPPAAAAAAAVRPQILDAFLVYALATCLVQVRALCSAGARCCPLLLPAPVAAVNAALPLPRLLQLAYMLLVGTFPFNAFLAGFLSSLGFFTLTGAPHPVRHAALLHG